MLFHASLLALFTTTALASGSGTSSTLNTPFLSATTHKSLFGRAPSVDCTDPSSFTCEDCFGPGFEPCPKIKMMCFHPEYVGEDLGCLDPKDPDFDEKVEQLRDKMEEVKGDLEGELQDKVDEITGGDKDEEKDEEKGDEDGEEGAAAGLGPRGLMGAVVGAGVLMAVM